jgi:hypothetical protein
MLILLAPPSNRAGETMPLVASSLKRGCHRLRASVVIPVRRAFLSFVGGKEEKYAVSRLPRT